MISPSDIKAGAQFVVTVARDGVEGGWVRVKTNNAATDGYIAFAYLFPLPAPSPTAAIDAEIAALVDVWDQLQLYPTPFHAIVERRRAMLKQKDAVGQLLEAVEATLSADGLNGLTHLPKLRLIAARVRKERDE